MTTGWLHWWNSCQAYSPETEISDQVVVELHQRYPFNVEKIAGYMETIREDGSWPDINYNDQKRSGWSVKEHADRVLELAKLYRAEEGDCHWEPKLESVIHLALGYWFREKPVCKNWWYNRSVFPRHWDQLSSLMKEQLNPEEKGSRHRGDGKCQVRHDRTE